MIVLKLAAYQNHDHNPFLNSFLQNDDHIIESLLLSFCVPKNSKDPILNIGISALSYALFMDTHMPNIVIFDSYWQRIQQMNLLIEENKASHFAQIFYSNFIASPPRFAASTFSYVVINSFVLQDIPLETWFKFALLMLKPHGEIYFLIPESEIQSVLYFGFEKIFDIDICPLWNNEANNLIIKAKKGDQKTQTKFLKGMDLSSNFYTIKKLLTKKINCFDNGLKHH